MHKFMKVLTLTMFSLTTTQSSYAIDGGYPNDPREQAAYNQDLYNQAPPDMSDENAFMRQSTNRMNQMRQANRNMMTQNRNMMREGYDPNEIDYGGAFSNAQGPYHSYPNQEQMLQGQYQESYRPGGNSQAK